MKSTLRGVLAAAFILVMCGVCVRLGFWQLDRLKQRKARNHAIETGLAAPPLDYDSLTALRIERDPASYANRRLRVTGTYDPAGEVVLRGRSNDSNPGVHLVTPMVAPGVPRALLVNRGWVPSPDAATVDPRPYAEPGVRTVTGVLMEVPSNTMAGGQPTVQDVAGAKVTTYRRLDLNALKKIEPRPIEPLYLQQLPGPDSAPARPPIRVALPPLDNGPHLSYAVQWFSFAIIGVVGLVIILVRNRRRDEDAADAPPV